MKIGVVKPIDIRRVMRFDGSYHLADSRIFENIIYSHKWQPLSAITTSIFTSGRNKRMYTSQKYGYPFLSNSDVVSTNPFLTCKYDSIKYNHDPSGFLKDGMIVTGRVGAIGQTAFISKRFENKNAIGSDNIIRIVCSPDVANGYIYAFLASKIGNLMFWKHSTGGVQPYITDKMVANIPVPVFPEEMQKEIDQLIRDAASLRDKAAELLSECISEIESKLQPKLTYRKTGKVSIKEINNSHNTRFEANYHISKGAEVDKYIRDNFEWKQLSDVCYSISRPDIFKRYYVKNGIPFLGGSDIFLSIPDGGKFLSKTKTSNIPALKVENGWILMPRSGTIGNVVLSHDGHAQKLVSEDVIRLVPNDILRGGYVYAFLSTTFGKALIQRAIFGAVIQHVESPHLSLIPIPVLQDDLMCSIHKRIMIYKDCLSEACDKELKAISMVETEIESWDKNRHNK